MKTCKISTKIIQEKKGCNNGNKAKIKVVKIYDTIKNQSQDLLHQLSTKFIRGNQCIAIAMENLKISNRLKNHKLIKALSEAAWRILKIFLEYKAKWCPRNSVIAPSHYASSQLCSHCEDQNKEWTDLQLREWVCLQCGSKNDRDINAAQNLLKFIKN